MPRARRSALLTVAQVAAKHAAGFKLTEDRHGRGAGSLVVRWGSGDTRWFYYRYTDPERRQVAIPLPVATLTEARAEVDRLVPRAREARARGQDLRAMLGDDEAARRQAEAEARAAALRAAHEAQRGTLKVLLDAYVGHLERNGKQAAGDARRMFARLVTKPNPELAAKRAADVTPDEIAALVRTVVEAGHGRSAAKLRSYLRAAYALAQRARLDATAPAALLALGIETNPAAATAALPQFNRARDRVLTDAELGYYAHALDGLAPSPARDALRLALLLGGQRPTQLLRCAPGDVDLTARTITLRDPKGKRTTPRLHMLPVSDTCAAILAERLEAAGESLLFTTGGTKQTRIETCEEIASALFAGMASEKTLREEKALGDGAAQLRDVRRTAETMLARLGVSRDVRGQLMSHGLSGLQQRHYDRHDYMLEKAAALGAWERHIAALVEARKRQLERPAPRSARVVSMERARKRRQ